MSVDDSRDGTPLAIDARGVCKRYGDRDALRGVDLLVPQGRLHGLLGPNGAGKTTMMRILLGLTRADAGSVHVRGRDVQAGRGGVEDGVAGFVETPGFYPYLSGRRNLMLLVRLDGGPSSRRREQVDRVLHDVGLSDRADVAVSGYSAGMRQRLAIAAALLRSPRLLILDEPTSSLDPASARDVRALIRRMADDGAAVLLSSHDMAEVEELCEQLTVIDKGQVVYAGTVDDLRQRAAAAVHLIQTSDDRAAVALACQRGDVKVRTRPTGEGDLEVVGDVGALDTYVIALGRAGIAVRALERSTRSLESLFLELTGDRESADSLSRVTRPADVPNETSVAPLRFARRR